MPPSCPEIRTTSENALATRTRSLTAIAAALLIAFAAGTADARAGKSTSSGSRGTRTYDAPATTNTAPTTAAPMQRSATPDTPAAASRPGMAAPAAQSGGFFSRGGFMGALAGGLLGAGLFGLLSGSGLFGGMAGFASVIGLLLQLALIGGLIWLAVRFFRSRQQPAYAGASAGSGMAYEPQGRPGVMGGGMGAATGAGLGGLAGGLGGAAGQRPAASSGVRRERADEIGIGPSDYQEFEGLLVGIQDAYGREDAFALRQMATPEMAKYFTDDLAENASRGLHNRVSDAQLLQGDLAESWREPGAEYATVAMRFALVDVTVERATGRVVEGDPNTRTEATELWTFRRAPGGRWQLSAIQQAN